MSTTMRIGWRSRINAAVLAGLVALLGVALTVSPAGAQGDDPPTAQIGPDSIGAIFEGQVELSGTAFDDNGIARVGIAIRDSSGQWLNDDGTFGSFRRHDAVLATPGTEGTGWTFSRELPEGAYGLSVAAFDDAGQRSELSPWTRFSVRAEDSEAPRVFMNELAGGRVQESGSVTLTGLASDASGVAAITVWVYDTDDCGADGIDYDNCSLHKLPAELADPGAPTTAWSLKFEVPDGQWRAEVRRARDVIGNTVVEPGVGVPFAIGTRADTEPPVAVLDSNLDGAVFRPDQTVRIGVSVTDDVLPVGGFLVLRNVTTGESLQADGGFAPEMSLFGFDLPREGYFRLDLRLEPGDYHLVVKGYDHASKLSVGTESARFSVAG